MYVMHTQYEKVNRILAEALARQSPTFERAGGNGL